MYLSYESHSSQNIGNFTTVSNFVLLEVEPNLIELNNINTLSKKNRLVIKSFFNSRGIRRGNRVIVSPCSDK